MDPAPSIGVLASPNPTRGATTITFDLDRGQEVQLEVFNLQGRRIRILAEGDFPAGRHELRWDGNDHQGRRVAAGTYFYRLRTQDAREVGKIVILR